VSLPSRLLCRQLEKGSSKQLVKLICQHGGSVSLPPAQKHLRDLILNQLAVLKSPTRRCMWHPAVLEFASAIYTASPSAYAEAIAGGVMALPSLDCAKKCSRQVKRES